MIQMALENQTSLFMCKYDWEQLMTVIENYCEVDNSKLLRYFGIFLIHL